VIRPQPCRWFEVVVARDDAFIALEALAGAATAEIEWHTHDSIAQHSGRPDELLKRYAALAQRYRPYWPPPATHREAESKAPADALAAAVDGLGKWAQAAEPLVAALQAAEAQQAELSLAESALAELAGSHIDFSLLGQANHGVSAALFALPRGVEVPVPEDLLVRTVDLANERLLLAVGPAESIETMGRAATEANGRRARFPDWLAPSAQANLELVAEQKARLQAELAVQRARLHQTIESQRVDALLADVARATWCFEHGGAIHFAQAEGASPGDVFARITGWTAEPQRLIEAVESSGARALLRLPPPAEWPKGVRPPLVLRNPWWARPFELFPRLVGMPGASGADPSVLLAFAVPLMFGYMFGDVGQGLVLAAVGWALRNRMPTLRLLVPGGIAASGFGFVFGSVFCLETVVHPLWLLPLEAPLTVLLVPLIAGAVLLTLGQLIGLLEAWWQQRVAHWAREDAPALLVYLGALLALLHPTGWLAIAVGAIWAAAGAIWAAAGATAVRQRGGVLRTRISAALAGIGELVEKTLQVLINTLSFARVGAFALAHSGLASAVVALAEAAGHGVGFWLVLVLGNLLILAIEGLIVSIQTTRLVLFEFFTRFFKPEGRAFRPLAPPPVTVKEI
jgi:V/A-type H+-transporting ATPase subunit I